MTESDPQDQLTEDSTEAAPVSAENTEGHELFPVPADRSDDDGAKGYAVYNQQLGMFLPGLHKTKGEASKTAKALDYLHVVKV